MELLKTLGMFSFMIGGFMIPDIFPFTNWSITKVLFGDTITIVRFECMMIALAVYMAILKLIKFLI